MSKGIMQPDGTICRKGGSCQRHNRTPSFQNFNDFLAAKNEPRQEKIAFQNKDDIRKASAGNRAHSKMVVSLLSNGERQALSLFTGNEYDWINKTPAASEDVLNASEVSRLEEKYFSPTEAITDIKGSDKTPEMAYLTHKYLDSALQKSRALARKRIVYRGVDPYRFGFDGKAFVEGFEEGKIVNLNRYTSTTKTPAAAYEYTSDARGVIFEIETKSGTDVSMVSEYGNTESEVLLPKDIQYHVHSVEMYDEYCWQHRSGKVASAKNMTIIQLQEI